MKSVKNYLLLLLPFFFVFGAAKAQEGSAPTSVDFLPLPAIHITDTVINKIDNGKISGTFTVRNSEEDEFGGLHYQMLLISPLPATQGDAENPPQDNYEILDRFISSEVFAIPGRNEGDVPFSYALPKVPGGNYVLRTQIITNKGTELGWDDHDLNLSQNPAIPFASMLSKEITTSKVATATPWEGVNVEPKEQITLKYEVKNSGKEAWSLTPVLNIWEFSKNRNSVGTFKGEKVTIAAGKSVELSFPVEASTKPEAYTAELTLRDTNGEQASNVLTYRWVVKGASAEISVVRVTKPAFKKDELMGITAEIAGSADQETFVNVALEANVLSDGKVIGTQKTDFFSLEKDIKIVEMGVKLNEDASDPQIQVKIFDEQGNTLEEDSFGLSARKIEKTQEEPESSLKIWDTILKWDFLKYFAIAVGVIILIIGVVFWIRDLIKNRKVYRGKYTKVSVLILALTMAGFFGHKVLGQTPAQTKIQISIPFHAIPSSSPHSATFDPIPSPPAYPFTFSQINQKPTRDSSWTYSSQGWWKTRSWKKAGSWCTQPGCDTISGQRIFINRPIPGVEYGGPSVDAQYYIKIGACANVPNFYHKIYAWWNGQGNWTFWVNGKGNYACPTGAHQCWTESSDFRNTITLPNNLTSARLWMALWEYGTNAGDATPSDQINTISDAVIDFNLKTNSLPSTTVSLAPVLTGMSLSANATVSDTDSADTVKKIRWEITSRPEGSALTFPGGNLTIESGQKMQNTNNADVPGTYCVRAKAQDSQDAWGDWSAPVCAEVKQLTCVGSATIKSEEKTNLSATNGEGYEPQLFWSASGGMLDQNTGTSVNFTAPKVETETPATYSVTVQARDTSATAGTCTITVAPKPTPPPTLSCVGPSISEIFSGEKATFIVTDPREATYTYTWKAIRKSDNAEYLSSSGQIKNPTLGPFVSGDNVSETYNILVSEGDTSANCSDLKVNPVAESPSPTSTFKET